MKVVEVVRTCLVVVEAVWTVAAAAMVMVMAVHAILIILGCFSHLIRPPSESRYLK